MKKIVFSPFATLSIVLFSLATLGASSATAAQEDRRAVDLVICLDVSGSMEPLLDATRARVWDVVAELARMRPTPDLRVGILTFGSEHAPSAEGWVRLETDLSSDLDAVYARLMALKTGGGEERVGRALTVAVEKMSWSAEWKALRMVFVAGNESADQGVEDFDFRHATTLAEAEDILINALYAGPREEAIEEHWPEIARRGHGNFSAIDPEIGMAQTETPQDETLLELNQRLNATYVPYGPRGGEGLANQVAQDSNASRLGVESCSSRIVAKGGALYNNASWDLVDATLQDDFRWSLIHAEDLPEAMRMMSEEQRIAFIETKRTEREAIQRLIGEVSTERETFLREAFVREDAQGPGRAMREAIRAQAVSRGFVSI